LDAAAKLGAEALDGSDGLEGAIGSALSAEQEIDVVFECSGAPALANAALEIVRGGGTIVVLALYDDPVTFNPTILVQKEIRMQGSIAYTAADFADAVELLRTGKAQATPLITQRSPLGEIAEAFEVQLEKDRSLKVVVTPNGG
jgi:threonine dehydrogenase-like Zn-dependent dehydrogenase